MMIRRMSIKIIIRIIRIIGMIIIIIIVITIRRRIIIIITFYFNHVCYFIKMQSHVRHSYNRTYPCNGHLLVTKSGQPHDAIVSCLPPASRLLYLAFGVLLLTINYVSIF